MAEPYLLVKVEDRIATLTMNRPDKRNAMSDGLLAELDAFFSNIPDGVRVVVMTGAGGHYCSGLDLSEHVQRDSEQTMRHSRNWHAVMDRIQYCGVPIVSAMQGAVIGGGLELATVTHVRIAEPSVIFQLPEGRRGIFVGGGATVRVGRILGADRMIEMMLTGRKYGAEDGERLGLAHYAVGEGEALPMAYDLARKIADNAGLSNYVMVQAISRIEDMAKADGFFAESLCAALTQTSPDAVEGLAAFLEKRPPAFR
ncbi:MAG: crotonase/enoyl-CoA hydratase family protein [Pseudomonadota bacterium]|nr:crotonase/enoyl-CoA hydratase family protein [Pseudomonadota bacterium]